MPLADGYKLAEASTEESLTILKVILGRVSKMTSRPILDHSVLVLEYIIPMFQDIFLAGAKPAI